MDRQTYKAARRAIICNGLKEIADGLYGLRMTLAETMMLEEMMSEGIIDVELDDE